jgi:hypothetical protein
MMTGIQQKNPFTPSEHFIQIKTQTGSNDYLPVQWRLVWFREQCPGGSIETEMLHLDLDRATEDEVYVWNAERRRSEKVIKRANGFVVFRAVAKDGKGGVGTGTKSEKAAAFGDYIEKAESGAIGRALAALGYGTQFTGDELNGSIDAPGNQDTPKNKTATEAGKENGQTNLESLIKQAKRRAEKLGLAKDAAEWANLLAAASVTVIKSAADLEKVTTHMDQFEREQEANAASPDVQPKATEQQITSIKKLCGLLGREVPDLNGLTEEKAGQTIIELSAAYKEARQAVPVR